jgi:branched-chain amino acid transport system permease protein
MNYLLHLLIYLCIYGILALSLNLVVGYCGLMTLAHAAYFAVGAYAYSLLSLNLHWGFVPAAIAGMFIAMVLSLAVSMPAWRFKGDLFVMVSLAVQALIFSLLQNWTSSDAPLGSWQNLTNGPFGIPGVPKPTFFGFQADTLPEFFLLSAVTLGLCCFIVWRLVTSPWGRLLKCLRDDELAARSLGKNTRKAKLEAFAFACGLAAVAGALYAGYIGYVDPSSASLDESILMLCMVIVGGVGNFKGPLVGAAVLIALPELLRFAQMPDSISANMRLLIYGLLLVLMAHFRPKGLAGDYRFQ